MDWAIALITSLAFFRVADLVCGAASPTATKPGDLEPKPPHARQTKRVWVFASHKLVAIVAFLCYNECIELMVVPMKVNVFPLSEEICILLEPHRQQDFLRWCRNNDIKPPREWYADYETGLSLGCFSPPSHLREKLICWAEREKNK